MNSKSKNFVEFVGKAKTGLGKGRYFMRQPGYKRQFIKKLGINPYHGTFNISLSSKNFGIYSAIKRRKGIMINGFKKGDASFGGVVCYNAQISGIKCALAVPMRTAHVSVAEIISSVMLRRALKLKDGDRVKVRVEI